MSRSGKREKFIGMILEGWGIGDAASRVGVSRRQGERYLASPEVRRALRAGQDARWAVVSARFVGLLELALDALRAGYDGPVGTDRKWAAAQTLRYCAVILEFSDLLARVEAIEQEREREDKGAG